MTKIYGRTIVVDGRPYHLDIRPLGVTQRSQNHPCSSNMATEWLPLWAVRRRTAPLLTDVQSSYQLFQVEPSEAWDASYKRDIHSCDNKTIPRSRKTTTGMTLDYEKQDSFERRPKSRSSFAGLSRDLHEGRRAAGSSHGEW